MAQKDFLLLTSSLLFLANSEWRPTATAQIRASSHEVLDLNSSTLQEGGGAPEGGGFA